MTATAHVVEHAVKWLIAEGEEVDHFCCIYPTAPFIRATDLKKAFEILCNENASEVFPVTTFDFCVFRALNKKEDGGFEMFWPENELTRSQDLPEALHDAGQFYMFECKAFLDSQKMWDPNAKLLKVPRYLVQDIDTVEDWEMAEMMYDNCLKKGLL